MTHRMAAANDIEAAAAAARRQQQQHRQRGGGAQQQVAHQCPASSFTTSALGQARASSSARAGALFSGSLTPCINHTKGQAAQNHRTRSATSAPLPRRGHCSSAAACAAAPVGAESGSDRSSGRKPLCPWQQLPSPPAGSNPAHLQHQGGLAKGGGHQPVEGPRLGQVEHAPAYRFR